MAQRLGDAGVYRDSVEGTARYMAKQLTRVFQAHDERDRSTALESCKRVDRLYFQHVSEDDIHLAAKGFVDALWNKDDIEFQYLRNGRLDREGLADADWGPVRQKFRQRAVALDIDREYVEYKTRGWRRHKTGGDYLTPFQRAQTLELRAALQDPGYPRKPRYGQSGPGPEPVRYALGIELHDMHTSAHWQQARRVMTPYFKKVLQEHDTYGNSESH